MLEDVAAAFRGDRPVRRRDAEKKQVAGVQIGTQAHKLEPFRRRPPPASEFWPSPLSSLVEEGPQVQLGWPEQRAL